MCLKGCLHRSVSWCGGGGGRGGLCVCWSVFFCVCMSACECDCLSACMLVHLPVCSSASLPAHGKQTGTAIVLTELLNTGVF